MSRKSVYTSRMRPLSPQKAGALATYNENKMTRSTFDNQVAKLKAKHGENLLDWPPEARAWYRSVKIVKEKK